MDNLNSYVGVFHFNLLSLRAKACSTFRRICVGVLTECDHRAGCLTLLRFHLPTLSESAEAFLSNSIESPVSNASLPPSSLPFSMATPQQIHLLQPLCGLSVCEQPFHFLSVKSLLAKQTTCSRDVLALPSQVPQDRNRSGNPVGRQ